MREKHKKALVSKKVSAFGCLVGTFQNFMKAFESVSLSSLSMELWPTELH